METLAPTDGHRLREPGWNQAGGSPGLLADCLGSSTGPALVSRAWEQTTVTALCEASLSSQKRLEETLRTLPEK